MRHSTTLMAVVLGALLGLLVAAPVGAATTGTVCGQVTAFTAPTATTDGDITIDGETEVIDSSAFGAIDASVVTVLNAVAAADATTCVEIVANDAGDIIDIEIAAQAEICGEVALDAVTGDYAVGGVTIPAALVAADADLAALLDAAATAGAELCADVTIDQTTGLITTASISGTFTVCGEVTLDADSATVGGADISRSLFDAEADAALRIAAQAGAEACVQLVVDDTAVAQANLSADITLCGEVTFDADGNAVVGGVTVDDDLLSAGTEALLALAASADGEACVTVVAVSTNGDTTVTASATVELCAEVTAIGDGTITLDDVTLGFAGAADADIEVGDVVCVTAATGPTGEPVVTAIDLGAAAPGDGDATPRNGDATPGGGDDDAALPDTSTGRTGDLVALGIGMLAAAFAGGAAIRRFEGRAAR